MKPEDLIALLAPAAPGLRPAADAATPNLWVFDPCTRRRATATLRLDERWITVTAALPGDPADEPLHLLRMQSALAGGVKLVRQRSGLALRAEIPLIVETASGRDWMRRQLAHVAASVAAALGEPRGESARHQVDPAPFDAAMLAEQCAAAGFGAKVLPDGDVSAEFIARSLPRVAIFSRCGDEIRAAVTLETGALGGPAAVASYLLRASRSLRGVRAFAVGSDDAVDAIGFECRLVPPGDDQPVVRFLDALAAACELCGREAEALAASATLSRLYLQSVEGASAPSLVANRPVPPGDPPAPRATAATAVA